MKQKATVVVMGIMAWQPVAGVTWQGLQYLEGLRRLGYDVYYVEDTPQWPGFPDQNSPQEGIDQAVEFLGRMLKWAGMQDRWIYRSPLDNSYMGPMAWKLKDLLARADALLNITASAELVDDYLRVPVRIYLETDPTTPQIAVSKGEAYTINFLSAHTHHFTYGENFGAPDCGVPIERFTYYPTRPPIVLDWWMGEGVKRPANPLRYTTIASWHQQAKDIQFRGQTYRWSKHHEFLKFIDLPKRRPVEFELALAAVSEADVAMLRGNGWHVSEGLAVSRGIERYRDFIAGSRGEFTVAKDQNIRLRSGWFSDRSACYLAAGRPVITQETGFSNILPTGEGLFGFLTMDDILRAVDKIESDYPAACRAARGIAEECFAAEKVLGSLMERSGL